MYILRSPLVHSLLLLACCSTAVAGDVISDAGQLRKLFTNKTAQGVHLKKNWNFHVYFAPDGSITRLTENGDRHNGTWRISEDGKHCVHFSNKEKENCRSVVAGDETGVYYRIRTVDDVTRQITRLYDFRDGNHLPADGQNQVK